MSERRTGVTERRTVKIGDWEFPESLTEWALRNKKEAERQDRQAVRDYHSRVRDETKDGQITFRIARSDIAKLKRIADGKNRRYQAYLRDILRREIRKEALLAERRAAAS